MSDYSYVYLTDRYRWSPKDKLYHRGERCFSAFDVKKVLVMETNFQDGFITAILLKSGEEVHTDDIVRNRSEAERDAQLWRDCLSHCKYGEQLKHSYHVYLDGKFIADTYAVSEEKAVNNVRWNHFISCGIYDYDMDDFDVEEFEKEEVI